MDSLKNKFICIIIIIIMGCGCSKTTSSSTQQVKRISSTTTAKNKYFSSYGYTNTGARRVIRRSN